MKHPKEFESTPETRRRMANVKLKNGTAECLLAKELWHRGYRYRKNYKKMPGSPDIALQKYHIAIFVDGEFWHGKDWETKKAQIKHNREYWIQKIEENMARDIRNDSLLRNMGWTPVHFWEKEVLKSLPQCVECVESLVDAQRKDD